MRALECSGPCPSDPCGRSIATRDVLAPLVLRRRDELVDDDLRAVGEVAELRLPQDERLGPLDAVAVLEARAPTNSESGLSTDSNGACFGSSVASGVHASPVAVSK